MIYNKYLNIKPEEAYNLLIGNSDDYLSLYLPEEDTKILLDKIFSESPKYSYRWMFIVIRFNQKNFEEYSDRAIEVIRFNPKISYKYLKLLIKNDIFIREDNLIKLLDAISNSSYLYDLYLLKLIKIMLNSECERTNEFLNCFEKIFDYCEIVTNDIYEYILFNKIQIEKEILKILNSSKTLSFANYVKNLNYINSDIYKNFYKSLIKK